MKPYYEDDAVCIILGDCREIVPTLGRFDLLLKKPLTNSNECATMKHENKSKRTTQNGDGASRLGTAQSGDSMAVSQPALVNGADCGLLRGDSDRDGSCNAPPWNRIAGAGAQGGRERALQGRDTEQALPLDDREGQVCGVCGDGEACGASQERESFRQSLGESASAVLGMPQSKDKNTVLETDESKWGILSDPPYGIGYIHGDGGGCLARSTQFAGISIHGDDKPFDPSFWLQFSAVILWGANHYASRLPDSPSWLIWDKREGICSNDQADCELAWTNLGGPARLMRHLWNGMIKASERGERRAHPTQKPVAVMSWCISMLPKGLTILDPFAGSGTTGRAAKDLGRKAVLIEREERYCEIGARRMAQEVFAL